MSSRSRTSSRCRSLCLACRLVSFPTRLVPLRITAGRKLRRQVEYPLTEAKVHLGPPHNSNFGYSHAKRLVDIQNKAYKAEFNDNFTSVIPTNIFGEYDNYVSDHMSKRWMC